MNKQLCPVVRTLREIAGGMLLLAVLAGCLNDSAEPTIDLNATPLPGEAITVPTETPEAESTPTPPTPDWLAQLLEPGPAALVSPGVFFQNGPDAWLVDSNIEVRRVTERRRIGAVATVPGSLSAAVLLTESAGGRESEEIRIIDADGQESEPVYGPEITGDPGGNPGVRLLRWSPDGQTLAIVRDDDSILLARTGEPAAPLELSEATPNIEAVRWSPNNQALALLYRPQGSAGVVRVVPVDGSGMIDIQPERSFGTIEWPSGPPALVASEDRGAGQHPSAGSLFTFRPSGDNRDLLVSAGEFGPAIRIGLTSASPDGGLLAFTVETPGTDGEFAFQSLNVLDLTSGISRRFTVSNGYSASQIWWFEGGLLWRATTSEEGPVYTGVEPFILEVGNLETGESRRIFTSDGDSG